MKKRFLIIILIFISATSIAPNTLKTTAKIRNEENPLATLAQMRDKLPILDSKLEAIEYEQAENLKIVENPKELRKIKRKLRRQK